MSNTDIANTANKLLPVVKETIRNAKKIDDILLGDYNKFPVFKTDKETNLLIHAVFADIREAKEAMQQAKERLKKVI